MRAAAPKTERVALCRACAPSMNHQEASVGAQSAALDDSRAGTDTSPRPSAVRSHRPKSRSFRPSVRRSWGRTRRLCGPPPGIPSCDQPPTYLQGRRASPIYQALAVAPWSCALNRRVHAALARSPEVTIIGGHRLQATRMLAGALRSPACGLDNARDSVSGAGVYRQPLERRHSCAPHAVERARAARCTATLRRSSIDFAPAPVRARDAVTHFLMRIPHRRVTSLLQHRTRPAASSSTRILERTISSNSSGVSRPTTSASSGRDRTAGGSTASR